MIKVKSKINNKIFYFRFLSEIYEDEFWYTETIEASGFNCGSMNSFEPIGKTWEEIINENR